MFSIASLNSCCLPASNSNVASDFSCTPSEPPEPPPPPELPSDIIVVPPEGSVQSGSCLYPHASTHIPSLSL